MFPARTYCVVLHACTTESFQSKIIHGSILNYCYIARRSVTTYLYTLLIYRIYNYTYVYIAMCLYQVVVTVYSASSKFNYCPSPYLISFKMLELIN